MLESDGRFNESFFLLAPIKVSCQSFFHLLTDGKDEGPGAVCFGTDKQSPFFSHCACCLHIAP